MFVFPPDCLVFFFFQVIWVNALSLGKINPIELFCFVSVFFVVYDSIDLDIIVNLENNIFIKHVYHTPFIQNLLYLLSNYRPHHYISKSNYSCEIGFKYCNIIIHSETTVMITKPFTRIIFIYKTRPSSRPPLKNWKEKS